MPSFSDRQDAHRAEGVLRVDCFDRTCPWWKICLGLCFRNMKLDAASILLLISHDKIHYHHPAFFYSSRISIIHHGTLYFPR